MNRDIPVWVWVVGAIVLFQVLDNPGGLVPFVVAFILWQSFAGSRRQVGRGPSGPSGATRPGAPGSGHALPTPPPPTGPPTSPPTGSFPRSTPPQGSDLPRIEVPRYPGAGGGTGAVPHTPSSDSAPRSSAQPSAALDPALSLGLLQLSQSGRDLEQARSAGDRTRVAQVLAGMGPVLDHLDRTAHASPGTEAKTLRAGIAPLREAVTRARVQGDAVDPSVLDRILTAVRRMGQTGGHE